MAWVVFYFSAFLFLHSSCSGLLANNHNAFIDGGNPGRHPEIPPHHFCPSSRTYHVRIASGPNRR